MAPIWAGIGAFSLSGSRSRLFGSISRVGEKKGILFFTIFSGDMKEMDCLDQSIAPSGLHKNREKMSLFLNPSLIHVRLLFLIMK